MIKNTCWPLSFRNTIIKLSWTAHSHWFYKHVRVYPAWLRPVQWICANSWILWLAGAIMRTFGLAAKSYPRQSKRNPTVTWWRHKRHRAWKLMHFKCAAFGQKRLAHHCCFSWQSASFPNLKLPLLFQAAPTFQTCIIEFQNLMNSGHLKFARATSASGRRGVHSTISRDAFLIASLLLRQGRRLQVGIWTKLLLFCETIRHWKSSTSVQN